MKFLWYVVVLTFCAELLVGCADSSTTGNVTEREYDQKITINNYAAGWVHVEFPVDAAVDTDSVTEQDTQGSSSISPDTALNLADKAAQIAAGASELKDAISRLDASQEVKDSYNPVTTTTNNTETQETDQDKSEDDSANQKPDNDNGDEVGENNKPPGEEDQGDMYGYKYADILKYVGPIQIAPAGQQGNSTYYYFLYRLPKGEHGYQTYGKKFLIKYPDGKAVTINDSRHDYNKKGYWYRPGDSSGHKEVHSMEVYWGKDGQWKSTSKADREKSVVKIYSNKERKK